jgi:hypothetical protein
MPDVTTSNWQAWVKKRPARPAAIITLHVTSAVNTGYGDFAFLMKRMPQGENLRVLMLDVKVENGLELSSNPQRIHYTELLKKDNQYLSAEIFFEDKKIEEINDITII